MAFTLEPWPWATRAQGEPAYVAQAPGSPSPAAATSGGSALGQLMGPLPPLGFPKSVGTIAAFDRLMLDGAETFRPGGARGFPQSPIITDANFYDLAYVVYQVFFRTGDTKWRDAARTIARAYRDSPSGDVRVLTRKVRGDYGYAGEEAIPPPRSASTVGLAVLAAETGDTKAREIVHAHARIFRCWGQGDAGWDLRESAYSLMAALAAVALGDGDAPHNYAACWNNSPPARTLTPRQLAKELLDHQLRMQGRLGPPGSLLTMQDADKGVPKNTAWSNLFMGGLVTEGWVMYDRIIGDPRIVPALEAYVDWMWSTQWYPKEKAFAYSNVTINWPNGNAARYPEPGLNGIYLGAWGYVAAKTGKADYRAQIDEILAGMLRTFASLGDSHNFFLVKMYPENFRNAAQGIGYLQ
jgi:hypothetical protein